MKKIIALMCFSLFAYIAPASSQTVMSPALDTITNTDTANLILRIPGSNNVLTFQLDVTKMTGTTAGTATVQGSLTGVASSYKDIEGSDTLTITNATTSYYWELPRSNYLYYKVKVLSTGTHTSQVKALALYRQD